ncbi:MAG: methyltransferase [Truepera sp.]|nr:methyltransferase [Truepera sp.]
MYDALVWRNLALPGRVLPYATKPGTRSYPELSVGVRLLVAEAELNAETLVDATGYGGVVALAAQAKRRVVLEPSAAALRCALATLSGVSQVSVQAGLPWDADKESAAMVCLAPAADKGTARVVAELQGGQRLLMPGGTAYLLLHKDQGAKRYEGLAEGLFGQLSVVAKSAGWRLTRLVKRRESCEPVQPVAFTAADLALVSYPGVFATGKLDPGTERLLAALDLAALRGKRVLDLGCGYGILALMAALAGAHVTGLDDDVTAITASCQNAQRHGLAIRWLHSDCDTALPPDEIFDVVVMNPPCHVGKQVRLELAEAFLTAARRRLRRGGSLTLVANKAMHYEPLLASWAEVALLQEDPQFKVLRAIKR